MPDAMRPRLLASRHGTAEQKWSPSQTASVVLVVSLLLWGVIILVFASVVF